MLALALLGGSGLYVVPARAQPATAAAAATDHGWSSLSPAQQKALQPLAAGWHTIDLPRRTKWIEIADRFPTLSPDEQARMQAKMTEWAQLSPADRGKARMLFQQAKQVSPGDRGSKWEAYQALPEDERRQLAERAARTASAARPAAASQARAASGERSSGTKSNLVPNPAFAAPPVAVSPTIVQGSPGATTSLMSQRPEPPSHQQTGLPKITAMPGFVDQATLQPRRGPQAAATRSAIASAPVPRP